MLGTCGQGGPFGVTIDTAMRFADKLQALCDKRGWNQSDLARAMSVSKNTASRWLGGKVQPFDGAFLKMGQVFGVPLEYLADDNQDQPHPGLSEAEKRILWLASLVGHEEAGRRLAAAKLSTDESPGGSRTLPAPVPGEEPQRRKQGG